MYIRASRTLLIVFYPCMYVLWCMCARVCVHLCVCMRAHSPFGFSYRKDRSAMNTQESVSGEVHEYIQANGMR